MENQASGVWSIVLAAGDGSRLKELTTTPSGETIPKQFCSLDRRECLLDLALQRAAAVSSPDKVGAIVAAQHRRWWRVPLQGLQAGNVIVQPSNRGTAVGAALALLYVERQDPNATVVLLPADHFVAEEATLASRLRELAHKATHDAASIYLLGAKPDAPDTELGYIVPAAALGGGGVGNVGAFVEKPGVTQASKLVRAGALWNMFIIAGSVSTILSLFERSYNFLQPMRSAIRQPLGFLGRLYNELPAVDFSRDVLAHYPTKLKVLEVPHCGWTDLGTPKRVAEIVKERARSLAPPRALYLDLARAVGDR